MVSVYICFVNKYATYELYGTVTSDVKNAITLKTVSDLGYILLTEQ